MHTLRNTRNLPFLYVYIWTNVQKKKPNKKHLKSYTDVSESKQAWEYFCKLKQNTRLPRCVEHYLWTHKLLNMGGDELQQQKTKTGQEQTGKTPLSPKSINFSCNSQMTKSGLNVNHMNPVQGAGGDVMIWLVCSWPPLGHLAPIELYLIN